MTAAVVFFSSVSALTWGEIFIILTTARAKGNTAILLNLVLDELSKEGIETELVSLAGKTIPGCRACFQCAAHHIRFRQEGRWVGTRGGE
jgi:multimeric flavodoxin WrbA